VKLRNCRSVLSSHDPSARTIRRDETTTPTKEEFHYSFFCRLPAFKKNAQDDDDEEEEGFVGAARPIVLVVVARCSRGASYCCHDGCRHRCRRFLLRLRGGGAGGVRPRLCFRRLCCVDINNNYTSDCFRHDDDDDDDKTNVKLLYRYGALSAAKSCRWKSFLLVVSAESSLAHEQWSCPHRRCSVLVLCEYWCYARKWQKRKNQQQALLRCTAVNVRRPR